MIYTGIGARKTPGAILHAMVQVGKYMAKTGHTLRSGGAEGADKAFQFGCDFKSIGKKQVFLPWPGYNHQDSEYNYVCQEAMVIASQFHPAWGNLSPAVKKLMGRNCYQILGPNLDNPSDFVICWTPKGAVIGGTGQALRMAIHYEIPIINFGNLSLDEVNEQLQEMGLE